MESVWCYIQTAPGFRILSPEQENCNNLPVSYRFRQCQNGYVNSFKVCGFYFKAQRQSSCSHLKRNICCSRSYLLWTVMVCAALALYCKRWTASKIHPGVFIRSIFLLPETSRDSQGSSWTGATTASETTQQNAYVDKIVVPEQSKGGLSAATLGFLFTASAGCFP